VNGNPYRYFITDNGVIYIIWIGSIKYYTYTYCRSWAYKTVCVYICFYVCETCWVGFTVTSRSTLFFFVRVYLFCDHYQRFTILGFRTTAQVYNINNIRATDQHKKYRVGIYIYIIINAASFAVFVLFRVILG